MKQQTKKPELLIPAGNYEKLATAYRYGADAVYIGMPDFSLRYRENQTTKSDLKKAVKLARILKKKIYITLNTYPHNISIKKIISHIKFLKQIKPDAIIFSDPGVFRLLKKYYKNAELHLSVQATCTNYETVKFWQEQGVKRIILARELSLKEIAKIYKECPNIELESFVHGAICMSYSGRCLLSNYMTGRDANQGDCAQPCRWNYKVLEENLRSGEYFPIYENQHGSHILSSRDLCLIQHLKKLYSNGITCFKVEGRAKNVNYVATITKAYRKAIDDFIAKKQFDKKLLHEVRSVSNRGFFTGFYYKKPSINDHQLDANRTEGTYDFIGIIKDFDTERKLATVDVKGQIKLGDKIEILTPNKIYIVKIDNLYTSNLKPINIYHPGLEKPVLVKIKYNIEKGDILRKHIK